MTPTRWKDSLGDYIDLDQVSLNQHTQYLSETWTTSDDICRIGYSHELKPVLTCGPILWNKFDVPPSLMVVWKQLVSTSTQFREEVRQDLVGSSFDSVGHEQTPMTNSPLESDAAYPDGHSGGLGNGQFKDDHDSSFTDDSPLDNESHDSEGNDGLNLDHDLLNGCTTF